jgi:membrane-associated phospholipid phosphatase
MSDRDFSNPVTRSLSPGDSARMYLLALVLAAAGGLAFAIDLPLARSIGAARASDRYDPHNGPPANRGITMPPPAAGDGGTAGPNEGQTRPKAEQGWRLPGDLRQSIELFEVFGHGVGIAVLMAAVFTLDARGRSFIPRLAACPIVAGLLADGVKLLVARWRPYQFDFAGSVWTTFHGVLPLGEVGHELRSFPSGHATTAAAFAAALAWRYPHGRVLFAFLAVMAAAQRLVSASHYASDVLLGAALGVFFTTTLLDGRLLGAAFDRLEGWLQRRFSPV